MERFYPDIKPHISPSALDAWHNRKGQFVRSYFVGEKTPETAAMKAGKKIHALVEGQMLEVQHNYANHELKLTQELVVEGATYKVLGIPDSFELQGAAAFFVDYKSGKENNWDDAKLGRDLKMKTTAWLVWHETGKPLKVTGFIEYIPTQWNPISKEVEPTFEPSVVAAEFSYTGEEMEKFTDTILSTINDINTAYDEWLESTDEFINQDDIAQYADLYQQKAQIDVQLEVLKERIADQMTLGGKESVPTPFGSFYFTTKRKYDIPKDLPVQVDLAVISMETAEKIEAATEAARKNYQANNPPVSETKSLGFRAKK